MENSFMKYNNPKDLNILTRLDNTTLCNDVVFALMMNAYIKEREWNGNPAHTVPMAIPMKACYFDTTTNRFVLVFGESGATEGEYRSCNAYHHRSPIGAIPFKFIYPKVDGLGQVVNVDFDSKTMKFMNELQMNLLLAQAYSSYATGYVRKHFEDREVIYKHGLGLPGCVRVLSIYPRIYLKDNKLVDMLVQDIGCGGVYETFSGYYSSEEELRHSVATYGTEDIVGGYREEIPE